MMKKYLIATILLLSSSCFAKHPIGIDGTYVCHGKEPASKKSFQCEKTLKKTGETYSSTTICNDSSANTGTGIYDEQTHRLSLAFIDSKKPEESGVAIEEVRPDGSLAITYAYLNKNTKGHATCMRK